MGEPDLPSLVVLSLPPLLHCPSTTDVKRACRRLTKSAIAAGCILAEIQLLAAVCFSTFDNCVILTRGAPDWNDCHAKLLGNEIGLQASSVCHRA